MPDQFSSFKHPKDRSEHFVRRSESIICCTVSTSVDLRKQDPTKHILVILIQIMFEVIYVANILYYFCKKNAYCS